MKNYIFVLFILMMLSAPHVAISQEDVSVYQLEDVNITARKLETFAISDKMIAVDSNLHKLNRGGSLATLLTKTSGLNIRSYGIGGLATSSIRGTGSNHTAVVWEGLNLQSQMNGSLDLNLTPAFMVDQVSVQYGGSSSMFGSGAMGGTIQIMGQQLSFDENTSVSLHQQLGSFGQRMYGMETRNSAKKISLGVRAFYRKADFDFLYYDTNLQREKELENAQIQQYGILTELAFRPDSRQLLTLKHWYQNNDTHIPKTAFEGQESRAIQFDDFHRLSLDYKNSIFEGVELNYKLGILANTLNYTDKIMINSSSASRSVINQVSAFINPIHKIRINLGMEHIYEDGHADNYTSIRTRNRTALTINGLLPLNKNSEVSISFRQALVDGEFVPFTPTASLNYRLFQDLELKTKLSRSYRIPTFNDLYWTGSGANGNPDLVAEDGLGFEIGYLIGKSFFDVNIHYEGTLFYNHIDNWIFWQQSESIWSPQNAEELWTYGFEQSLILSKSFSEDLTFSVRLNYQQTMATLSQPKKWEPDTQAVYTPKYQFSSFLNLKWRNLNINANAYYISKQYTDADNNPRNIVDPSILYDAALGYQFRLSKKHKLSLTFQAKNLLNTSYEVRRGYPMPGINYELNLVYNFNYHKS